VEDNDCTSTDWWKMALANNIIFYVMFVIIMVAVLVMFLIGYTQTTPKSNRVVDKGKEQLAESEERMMPGEENKEENKGQTVKDSAEHKGTMDSRKEEHKDGDTDDKNKSDKKDEEGEERDPLDEEMDEIY
jgi:cell division protein FtsN